FSKKTNYKRFISHLQFKISISGQVVSLDSQLTKIVLHWKGSPLAFLGEGEKRERERERERKRERERERERKRQHGALRKVHSNPPNWAPRRLEGREKGRGRGGCRGWGCLIFS